MRIGTTFPRFLTGATCTAALIAAVVGAGAARAGDQSCREWLREHCDFKAKAIGLYLRGAPQRELDVAVFELLQREAYLTSCEIPAHVSRGPMVGWRLVGRAADDYAGAVLESVLERAGLAMDLQHTLGDLGPAPVNPAPAQPASLATANGARSPLALPRHRRAAR
jgi:hypothetical protein